MNEREKIKIVLWRYEFMFYWVIDHLRILLNTCCLCMAEKNYTAIDFYVNTKTEPEF